MSLQRLTRTAALGLTLAAFTLPATAAAQGLDERHSTSNKSAAIYQDLRTPDAIDAGGRRSASNESAAVYQDLRTPDAIDAGERRGTSSAPEVVVVRLPGKAPAPAPLTDGIEWGDAGIGAAGMLGLAGLALAVAVMRRRDSAATA